MPRKPKAAAAGPQENEEPEILDRELLGIREFFDKFSSSSVYCRIERSLKSGEREECETIGMEQFGDNPAEYLRQNWGIGRFHVSLLNNQRRWVARETFNVAARMAPSSVAVVAGAPGAFDSSTFYREQMALAREQAAADRQLLIAMIGNQKGPDVGSLLQGIAAFSKPTDPAALFTSIVTAVQTMRGGANTDPIEGAKNLIELAKSLAPGGAVAADGEGGGWADIVTKVGLKVLDRLGPAAAAPAAVRASLPGPRPLESPAAVPGTATEGKTVQDFLISVKAGIEFLRPKAQAGREIGFWIDYLFEEQADVRFNAIIHAVKNGATIENLFEVAPDIATSPVEAEWFRGLYVGIQQVLAGDATPGTDTASGVDSAGAAGNSADAGNNAGARKAG